MSWPTVTYLQNSLDSKGSVPQLGTICPLKHKSCHSQYIRWYVNSQRKGLVGLSLHWTQCDSECDSDSECESNSECDSGSDSECDSECESDSECDSECDSERGSDSERSRYTECFAPATVVCSHWWMLLCNIPECLVSTVTKS